jgi:hypothetical protein
MMSYLIEGEKVVWSEDVRKVEINHFLYKHKRWKMTDKERSKLKTEMLKHPSKNGAPNNSNFEFRVTSQK